MALIALQMRRHPLSTVSAQRAANAPALLRRLLPRLPVMKARAGVDAAETEAEVAAMTVAVVLQAQ